MHNLKTPPTALPKANFQNIFRKEIGVKFCLGIKFFEKNPSPKIQINILQN